MSSTQQQLKPFEDVVEFTESGQKHNMVVLAVKANGVIDGAFFKQVLAGDGKTPIAIVGSSRQAEMVQFRHDVSPSQYSIPGDFYFSLTDEQAGALDTERKRRQHEAAQAVQAAASVEEEKQLLDGVTIKPSDKVLERAAELWKKEIRLSQGLDEHDDVLLPDYKLFAAKWGPWVDKAKESIAAEKPAPVQSEGKGEKGGEADPSKDKDQGLVN